MLQQASLGLKPLLLINHWKKISSEVKQMEKAEEKRCADAVTTVLVEFLGCPLSLLLCIKQICKYSQEWPTPTAPTGSFSAAERFGGLLPAVAVFRPLLVPPVLLCLIPSPVRQGGSQEGRPLALNPLRSKMRVALGAPRRGWNERLKL